MAHRTRGIRNDCNPVIVRLNCRLPVIWDHPVDRSMGPPGRVIEHRGHPICVKGDTLF